MRVELTLKNYRCFPDGNPARIIIEDGLTGLLGVNNSGKSSLLRFFYEFRDLFTEATNPNALIPALRGSDRNFALKDVDDPAQVFSNRNDRDLQIELQLPGGPAAELKSVITVGRRSRRWVMTLYVGGRPLAPTEGALELSGTTLNVGGQSVTDLGPLIDAFKALADTLYIGAFRNVINAGENQDYFDIQTGQAFVRNWRSLKTGTARDQSEAAFNLTKDIQRIFEFEDLEIESSDDDRTLHLFVNGKARKLREVGAGLAQFIVVLAHAVIKKPSFILIDEPELNLHPILQHDLLAALESSAKVGVVFATHSVPLAQAEADRAYTVRRLAEGESEVAPYDTTPRLSQFLDELLFSSYRELGFEQLLLVEGRTDMSTVRQLLRLYKKSNKVVLLSLGGGDMINKAAEPELHHMKRISDNVSALIDSERSAEDAALEPSREAFREVCGRAGIACLIVVRRAIENYFTNDAVKTVKGDTYRALQPYEALKEASPHWSKNENWRIAGEMTLEDLDATDLGAFLRSL